MASELVLTMKLKCSTYICQKVYEDVDTTKEGKEQQPDVEQQRQALPFKFEQ